jgi:hypothetical protein
MRVRFVYIATCPDVEDSDNSGVYVGIATNPILRLYSHNRKSGFPPGARVTRSRAPRWALHAVLGPFVEGSHVFRDRLCRRVKHGQQQRCRVRLYLVNKMPVQVGKLKRRRNRKNGLGLTLWLRGNAEMRCAIRALCGFE